MSTAKRLIEEQLAADEFDNALDALQRVYENGEMNEWEQEFFESMWERQQARQEFSNKMVAKILEMRERYDNFISYTEEVIPPMGYKGRT